MSTALKELPQSERPRERLLKYGAMNLANDELLAIILRTGSKGNSVKSLSNEILASYGDIHNLKLITTNKLKDIKGLGTVKAVTLQAALELGRRVYEDDDVREKVTVRNSLDVYRYFAHYIKDEKQENFLVVYLDTQKQYIAHKILFKGTLDSSVVHPREVFKTALLESASSIVLLHNHPSGVLVPSRSDDESTMAIVEAGNIIGIQVLDHLIVGSKDYYSYLEKGRLKYEGD